MNQYTLLVLTLLITVLVKGGRSLKKCCKSDEHFDERNGNLSCVRDTSKRLQVFTDETDFVHDNAEGECAETSDGLFFYFSVNARGNITRLKAVGSEEIFPKCCPLNFIYNSISHSCQERNRNSTFISKHFVKIGLEQCKIIQDHKLNTTSPTLKGLTSYCEDENEEGSMTLRECEEDFQVCDHVKCIKKCCPDGQSFVGGPKCVDTYRHGLNLTGWADSIEEQTEPFAIVHNRTCSSIYIFKPENYNFTISKRGTFTYWIDDRRFDEDVTNNMSYCVEHTKKGSYDDYLFFMCFGEAESEAKYQYVFYPLVVSSVLLLLTILIYFMVDEMKKMFGKILVSYCLAMMIEFALLANSYVRKKPTATMCRVGAFFTLFFATASFSWLNVLCWDIWCTFSSTKRITGLKQSAIDLKKILSYSCYGWGIPLFWTVTVFIFYTYNELLPSSIQPRLAETRCFFEQRPGNYGKTVFFNIPTFVMQIFNIVLFVKTVIYCVIVKNEINRINDTTRDSRTKKLQKDKERLFLILKLIIIMGMSYLFETVSAFFEMSEMGVVLKYVEFVWDFINASQGIFIFIVFICKKRILQMFFKKLKPQRIVPRFSVSSLNTQCSVSPNGIVLHQVNHVDQENVGK